MTIDDLYKPRTTHKAYNWDQNRKLWIDTGKHCQVGIINWQISGYLFWDSQLGSIIIDYKVVVLIQFAIDYGTVFITITRQLRSLTSKWLAEFWGYPKCCKETKMAKYISWREHRKMNLPSSSLKRKGLRMSLLPVICSWVAISFHMALKKWAEHLSNWKAPIMKEGNNIAILNAPENTVSE